VSDDNGGLARFESHGGPGRQRADGSAYSQLQDEEAFAAEAFGCALFGMRPDRTVGQPDPGWDFTVRVDIKHLGIHGDGRARQDGHLIVNPTSLRADRYYVVAGTRAEGFRLVGWATRADLLVRAPRDFGYGPKYWVPVEALRPALGISA
jgi:hypothetical protein